jgi:uncharacterized protein (DUF3084 family)
MISIIVAIISGALAILFLIMWLRARRAVSQAEIVAYGLRAQDDSDENTKTNLSMIEAEYEAAIDKLYKLGEIRRDDWGHWVWTKTGQQLGEE